MGENIEWFESWFDTKWYHILYKNRDLSEAEQFIQTLMDYLSFKDGSRLLDAACGAGRHSLQLNNLGYKVRGFDLSGHSIKRAKEFESDDLKFEVADLREFKSEEKYDGIFNFFTSFGYFESKTDNLKVLRNFRNVISPDGILLIDFMNAGLSVKNLVPSEIKEVEGVRFRISRRIQDHRIIKKIEFSDSGVDHNFEERVSAFTLNDFQEMLVATGFKIESTFGDYKLDPFLSEESPRLIILARPI